MSEPLWTMAGVLAAVNGEVSGVLPAEANGVSIDSRTLEPGDLFFAIRDRTDGHAYVDSALRNGAAAAIVVRGFECAAGGPLIHVDDPLEALNRLGAAARRRTAAKIVAVTGSVGKTSTKEMLRTVLTTSGATHASEKSYNNLWGVPLSLARMPQGAQAGVFEIGMNHAGEITPLTQLVRPHAAIVTTIAPVHLEFFAGTAAIAEAKAEIFTGIEPGGAAVINRNSEHFSLLEQRATEAAARVISFGDHARADVRLVAMTLESGSSTVTAHAFGETFEYTIGAAGRHLVLNSLAVLAALHLSGAPVRAIEALAGYTPPEGRGVRETFALAGGEVLIIDESYNANPASVAAAIAVLGSLPRTQYTRRIVVLGDMLELGHASAELHAKLAGPIDEAGADVVFACGPHMRNLFEALPQPKRGAYAAESAALQGALLSAIRPGDAVMIKGSLGSRMGPLASALKLHLRNG
jgi:UDP-N-acetylmuramoyl-tripeptide--D-alanyl-D-alanine ligase